MMSEVIIIPKNLHKNKRERLFHLQQKHSLTTLCAYHACAHRSLHDRQSTVHLVNVIKTKGVFSLKSLADLWVRTFNLEVFATDMLIRGVIHEEWKLALLDVGLKFPFAGEGRVRYVADINSNQIHYHFSDSTIKELVYSTQLSAHWGKCQIHTQIKK